MRVMDKKYKVLLVDDEPNFLELVTYRLKNTDYSVITASGGKECIELAIKSSPDIIILDIKMPELDGIATASKLKSIKETRSIPIIICTAVEEEEDEVVARHLAVAGYFRKTSGAKDLIAMIEKVLSK